MAEDFLTRWGVKHRISAAYNLHVILRAESTVRTAKRMLVTSTKYDGSPEWEQVARTLLQHCNAPIKGINLSLAQLLYGHRLYLSSSFIYFFSPFIYFVIDS